MRAEVYKGTGSNMDKSNYRPISVVGHVAKIFERSIIDRLLHYVTEHCFLSADQSAYRKFHSTQTSLHRDTEQWYWYEFMNDNLLTGVCFLDVKKCFATINHNILFEKLSKYGIINRELDWF